MSDLVVTVPKQMWIDWLSEGDACGEPPSGQEWAFYIGGGRPRIEPGECLYIIAWGVLRGYSPVTRVERTERGWAICRKAGAVACTIDEDYETSGFRGWRERWWPYEAEDDFEDWETFGIPEKLLPRIRLLQEERKLKPCKCGRVPMYYSRNDDSILRCPTCREFVGPDLPGVLPFRWNHYDHDVASEAFAATLPREERR